MYTDSNRRAELALEATAMVFTGKGYINPRYMLEMADELYKWLEDKASPPVPADAFTYETER